MPLIMLLEYSGKGDAARSFVREMEEKGIADEIRKAPGCLRYEYFLPYKENGSVLLIDEWTDQAALDAHHDSQSMKDLAALREKYDLHMKATRCVTEALPDFDNSFIRK